MLESNISEKVWWHLELHEVITDSQHGFTNGKSCLTNLLFFHRAVCEAADKGLNYDVIYLHFSKAFDMVLHKTVDKRKSPRDIS